jgi:hypothetical protein
MIFYYPGFISGHAESGSQVRLKAIKNVFQKAGYNIINGSFIFRQRALLQLLLVKKKQFIYMESSSIPFFMMTKKYFMFSIIFEILIFVALCKRHNVAIYYRDAHWAFDHYKNSHENNTRRTILILLHRLEKFIFCRLASRLLVPSKEFGQKVLSSFKYIEMPPGISGESYFQQLKHKNKKNDGKQFIYIGGLNPLLYSIQNVIFKIEKIFNSLPAIVCRKSEMHFLADDLRSKLVIQNLTDENLPSYCNDFSFAIIAFEDNEYMNLALPVKLFRALELGLIPLYRGNNAISRLCKDNNIGIHIDNKEFIKSFHSSEEDLSSYTNEIRVNISKFVESNSWKKRLTMLEDLSRELCK